MIEMEPSYLRLLFSKYEKDCIEKIDQLRDEIQVADLKLRHDGGTHVIECWKCHVECIKAKVVIDQHYSIKKVKIP